MAKFGSNRGLHIFMPLSVWFISLVYHCLIFKNPFKSLLSLFMCITFIHITVLRRSSFLTWAPIDVLFYQKATRLCLRRGAFSWRVSSSSPPWHTITATKISMLSLNCWKSWDPDSAGSFLGLPHFSVEPQHMFIEANISLSLSCVAHGPPEPVRVIWLQDGAPLNSLTDPVALSPSTLNLTGIILHSLTSAVKTTCIQPQSAPQCSHSNLWVDILWYNLKIKGYEKFISFHVNCNEPNKWHYI